jgi:hypothetical protein
MSDHFEIPLCGSEWLQDFSIQLGAYLKSENPYWPWFQATVDICECDGESVERFTVWVPTIYGATVNLTLWEDKTIWVSVGIYPTEGEKFQIGFYPNSEALSFERIINALRETISISTRLCYDESPEHLLRKIWSYDGDVEIQGVI